ncbi:sterile alpha motif domain-containing protein 1-like [Equus quagga]|uniref:sterile alpha motif domain-containing protein 1-like n=1 Tax=Equus quagga TaxID=89248 RepID=UPI001EE2C846|nr:sterile alpha motif domain-containing protein 1-like [Equus quagga]
MDLRKAISGRQAKTLELSDPVGLAEDLGRPRTHVSAPAALRALICLLPFLLPRPLPLSSPERGRCRLPPAGSRRPAAAHASVGRRTSLSARGKPSFPARRPPGLGGKRRGGGTAAPSHSGGSPGGGGAEARAEKEAEQRTGGRSQARVGWGVPTGPRPPRPLAQLQSRSPEVGAAPLPRAFFSHQAFQDAVERGQGVQGRPLQQEPSVGRTRDQASSPTEAKLRVWDAIGSAEGWLGAAESRLGPGLLGDRPWAPEEGRETSREETGPRVEAAASLSHLSRGNQGI